MTPNMVMVMGTAAQRLRARSLNVSSRWSLAAPSEPAPGVPEPLPPAPQPSSPPMIKRSTTPPTVRQGGVRPGSIPVRRGRRGKSSIASQTPGPARARPYCPPNTVLRKVKTYDPSTGSYFYEWVCVFCAPGRGCISWLTQ